MHFSFLITAIAIIAVLSTVAQGSPTFQQGESSSHSGHQNQIAYVSINWNPHESRIQHEHNGQTYSIPLPNNELVQYDYIDDALPTVTSFTSFDAQRLGLSQSRINRLLEAEGYVSPSPPRTRKGKSKKSSFFCKVFCMSA